MPTLFAMSGYLVWAYAYINIYPRFSPSTARIFGFLRFCKPTVEIPGTGL